MTIVDVGCQTGLLTGPLHDLGFDVFGIDIAPGMLAIRSA
jgi:2-polyprenyl-3-methyl-5-hydroxy-6-metoxy-1,4-benzoquinol methylase